MTTHWQAYEPNESTPWNVQRVVHMHRRSVFGATWSEITRDLNDEPQAAVDRVINGTSRIGTPGSFDRLADVIGTAAADSPNPDRLKAWWLYRCLFSPDPLQERLTLMWHNHFATSNLKINNLRRMKQQNETLRQHARSPFAELLHAMIRDPALLFWLDAPANRKGHPNENLARELMELFTIGIGHYTEHDVKETARALTGWTIRNGKFEQQSDIHDADEKTILSQAGRWNGNDVAEILLRHSATAQRLAGRLIAEFFGENVVTPEARQELVTVLQQNSLNTGATVETMLRSELFFSDANINSRVCDPVSFVIAPLRALECVRQPPSTLLLAMWLERMGQNLFYPPNVGGWNGGRSWLSTRTVIARTNYAAALAAGRLHNPVLTPDLDELLQQTNGQSPVQCLATLLGIRCDSETERLLMKQIQSETEQPAAAIVALMTQPEAHLH